ncbi:MAG: zinc-ribbon domain-containing protein, partial [Clostridia bacterium]|nr:zinc-ribbon domain-containing protein [Clostridia bacterium]
MAICKKCGQEVDDGVNVCPLCGTKMNEEKSSSNFEEKFKEINNTTDSTSEFEEQDIQSNKAMGILAYLSWLVLIPLFAAKGSKFARYHCNQGIVLAIAEIIAIVVLGLLSGIPFIGWIFSLVEGLIGLACF